MSNCSVSLITNITNVDIMLLLMLVLIARIKGYVMV